MLLNNFKMSFLCRTVLESAVLYSKEWLQRAENLQLMTMDEQKLFLKVIFVSVAVPSFVC